MNREAIFAALFALVSTPPALVTKSRKLLHWNDVPASQQPALFQAQGKQTVSQPAANGLPTKWVLDATLYVYVNTQGAASPGEVLNPILDAITAALDANAIGTPQTLGGLVEWARIEGSIETSEGTLGDQEVAMIPVRILTL